MHHASLSDFYPNGTVYFYSYPCFSTKYFFTREPAWPLDLVAARALLCAGSGVSVVAYAPTVEDRVWRILTEELQMPVIDRSQIIVLPESINDLLSDRDRDRLTAKALRERVPVGRLIMAQPYFEGIDDFHFQFPREKLTWLNDKANLSALVPSEELPRRYETFSDGRQFAESSKRLPLPCVVKACRSGSGSGVWICSKKANVKAAQKALCDFPNQVLVEERIVEKENLCIQFGVPADPHRSTKILGYNRQVIGENGRFLGGRIDPAQDYPGIQNVYRSLANEILPRLRRHGYYGVGGFDVLITADGRHYWIDGNLRMTASLPAVLRVTRDHVEKGLVTFMGIFTGSEQCLRNTILRRARRGAPDQKIELFGLAKHPEGYKLSGAILFENNSEIVETARFMLISGIVSESLAQIAKRPLSRARRASSSSAPWRH